MPKPRSTLVTSRMSGIITAWYGMNMPNRMSVKTTFAPGKRHLERTKPLALPSIAEMIADGTTSRSERTRPPLSWLHALTQFPVSQCSGRSHVVVGEASAPSLKEVTTRT